MTFRLAACFSVCLTFAANTIGDEPTEIRLIKADTPRPAFSGGPVPRTTAIANDATLNDVCGIGSECWAVGNRGVILRSRDGGLTWETSLLEMDSTLHSVCFLTNQIGFIAGETWDRFEHRRRSLLLKTRDGGTTWRSLDDAGDDSATSSGSLHVTNLPALRYVRFFDLENGIAVSSPQGAAATSVVLRTRDRGKTWTKIDSGGHDMQLCAAAFRSPDEGIVAGQGMSYGAVTGDRLVPLSTPLKSIRGIRGASLLNDGNGWLVGDGGLLLQTESAGVTWQPPTGRLSQKLNDIFDYRSVAQNGQTVCVVGRPGSVVLHSETAGKSWSFRALGNAATMNCVQFVGDTTALAVGTFGVIHRSTDNGLSWATVRNADYRAAVLQLTTTPTSLSFEALANLSGDQGFRTVVANPSVDVTAADEATVIAEQCAEATVDVAVNTFEYDWRFSRTKPLQAEVREELWKSWNRQTDSRVAELLPLRLAQAIRVWRPDVICIDSARQRNEVVKIWLEAMPAVRKIASGEDARGNVLDKVGLEPWTITRVVLRNDQASTSPLGYSAEDVLPNSGTTAGLIAGVARSHFSDPASSSTATYSVVENGAVAPTPKHLLAGKISAPGTASRRQLGQPSTGQRDLLQRLAKMDANLKSAVEQRVSRGETPLSMIANLRMLGEKLPPRLRLSQLQHLASVYESVGNLDGQIAVLQEMIDSYPDVPEAAEAAEQLFQFYSSAELRHLRRKSHKTDASEIRQAAGVSLPGMTAPIPTRELPPGSVGKEPISRPGNGTLLWNSNGAETSAVDDQWDRNAHSAFTILANLAPARSRSAKNLLRVAASYLRTDQFTQHKTVLSEASRQAGLFATLARAEMQAMHSTTTTAIPVVNLPRSETKPVLDAVLTDECWQKAIEMHLRDGDPSGSVTSDCLIMLAWDGDHVYVAGRIEHAAGRTSQIDNQSDRLHDTDHRQLDRVTFNFDTDRDHTTAFHFTIDESGHTSERCWTNIHWNPQWYVAAEADETVWRFEVAIPQEELLERPLNASDLWGIQVERILPGAIHQILTAPEGEANNDAEGHGLLRFIRRRSNAN